MSIRALRNEEHDYCDDIESFFYVFLWICCGWDGPKNELTLHPLVGWMQTDMEMIAGYKDSVMNSEVQFQKAVLPKFSPHFKSLADFALRFRKVLFPGNTGSAPVTVDCDEVESIFKEMIEEEKRVKDNGVEGVVKGVHGMKLNN
jgi:hypothetical protein